MRIVSLLASGTEMVCALGGGDMLVGRSHECDNPAWVRSLPACTRPAFDIDMPSRAIDAEVRRRLKCGEPLYEVDADLIGRLEPDLLITQIHCDVCAVTPRDIARAGCQVAARQVALSAGSVEEIYDSVRSVADAMDRPAHARALIGAMQDRIAVVSGAVRGLSAPTVVLLEWTDPIFATGNWGPELVEAAGGRPLLGQRGIHSSAISWHQVLEANPDALIVAPCGFDFDRAARDAPILEGLPGWSDLNAVKHGRVAFADGNKYFNRSGTTIVETVEILAEILHGYRSASGASSGAWRDYRDLDRTQSLS